MEVIMKKVVPFILDVFIIGIIVLWGYLLYKEFSGFTEATSQLTISMFNIKVILLGVFVIASVTIAFYINFTLLKKDDDAQRSMEKSTSSHLESYSVPESDMEQHVDTMADLEVIRKLLSSNLKVIDNIWENFRSSAANGSEAIPDETSLIKDLNAQMVLVKAKSMLELFDKIVGVSSDLTSAERLSLLLYNPVKKKLVMARNKGVNINETVEISTDEGLAGYAFKNVKRIYVTNIESHPELGRENLPQYNSKSFMIFPIKVFSGVVIGVLNLTEKETEGGIFSMGDLEKMNLLINTFSLKVENMILSNEYSKDGRKPEDLKKAILEFLKRI